MGKVLIRKLASCTEAMNLINTEPPGKFFNVTRFSCRQGVHPEVIIPAPRPTERKVATTVWQFLGRKERRTEKRGLDLAHFPGRVLRRGEREGRQGGPSKDGESSLAVPFPEGTGAQASGNGLKENKGQAGRREWGKLRRLKKKGKEKQ